MHIGKISAGSFNGNLVAFDHKKDKLIHSINTDNVTGIYLNPDKSIDISHKNPVNRFVFNLNIPYDGTDAIERYNRVISYYNAACQNDTVNIEIPELSKYSV